MAEFSYSNDKRAENAECSHTTTGVSLSRASPLNPINVGDDTVYRISADGADHALTCGVYAGRNWCMRCSVPLNGFKDEDFQVLYSNDDSGLSDGDVPDLEESIDSLTISHDVCNVLVPNAPDYMRSMGFDICHNHSYDKLCPCYFKDSIWRSGTTFESMKPLFNMYQAMYHERFSVVRAKYDVDYLDMMELGTQDNPYKVFLAASVLIACRTDPDGGTNRAVLGIATFAYQQLCAYDITPHGFSELISSIGDCLYTIWEATVRMVSVMVEVTQNGISNSCDSVLNLLAKGFAKICSGLGAIKDFTYNAIVDLFISVLTEYLDSGIIGLIKSVLSITVCSLLRYAMGYPAKFIWAEAGMELLLNPLLNKCLTDWNHAAVDHVNSGVVPQGETPVTWILAALSIAGLSCLGWGFSVELFSLITLLIDRASKLVQNGKTLGLDSMFVDLDKLIGCDSDEERLLRAKFPDTFKFIDYYSELIIRDKISASEQRILSGYKKKADREAKDYNRDANEMFRRRKLGDKFVEDHCSVGDFYNKFPADFVLFCGPPGLGKSRSARTLADELAVVCSAKLDANETNRSCEGIRERHIYVPNSSDQYHTGYKNQRIGLIDDFCQKNDFVGDNNPEFAFLWAATAENPSKLNMAGLDEKGTPCVVNYLIGATNVPFFVESNDFAFNEDALQPHVKSFKSHEAIMRRITLFILPRLKPGFTLNKGRLMREVAGGEKDGVITVPIESADKIDPDQLYTFSVYNNLTKEQKDWTFSDIYTFTSGRLAKALDYELEIHGDDEGLLGSEDFDMEPPAYIDDFEGLYMKNAAPDPDSCPCGRSTTLIGPDIRTICLRSEGYRANKDAISCYFLWTDSEKALTVAPVPFTAPSIYPDVKSTILAPIFGLIYIGNNIEDTVVRCKGSHGIELDPRNFRDIRTLCIGEMCHTWINANNAKRLNIKSGLYKAYGCIPLDSFSLKHNYPMKTARKIWLSFGLIIAAAVGFLAYNKKTVVDTVTATVSTLSDVLAKHGISVPSSSLEVDPHGKLVEINGEYFVKVKGKDGKTYFYPCGAVGQGQFDEALRSKKVKQQMPTIVSNLWVALSDNDTVLGNILALDENVVVTPLHIAYAIRDRGAKLRRENDVIGLVRVEGKVPVRIKKIGVDLALVTFVYNVVSCLKFVNCKTMLNKISTSFSPSEGVVVGRNADGTLKVLKTTFMDNTQPLAYSINGVDAQVRQRDSIMAIGSRDPGDCGSIYCRDLDSDSTIVGVHIAGHRANNNVFALRLTRDMIIIDDSIKPRHEPINTEAKPMGVSPPYGMTPLPKPDIVPTGIVGSTQYLPADLSEEAMVKAEMKFVGAGKAPKDVLEIPDALLRAVADKWCKVSDDIPRDAPDYDYTVGANELGSIDRTKAVGLPINKLHPTKQALCELGEEVKLTPETKADLLENEERLLRGEPVECITTASLKNEVRLLGKVLDAKTRVFQGAPGMEFLMQRRYFYRLVQMFNERNVSVGAATGLSPQDYGAIHMLSNKFKDPVVLTADIEFMDGSCNPYLLERICVLFNMWYTKNVDSAGMDRNSIIRLILTKRMATTPVQFSTHVIQPQIAHPSGSFITTALNIAILLVLWVDIFQAYHGCSYDEAVALFASVFLGDDSTIYTDRSTAPTPEFIIQRAHKHGFKITSEDKTSPLVWHEVWRSGVSDYTFLSRHFAVAGSRIVGLLTPERLFKMLDWVESGQPIANFSSTVNNFVIEYRMWHQFYPRHAVVKRCVRLLDTFGPDFGVRCLSMEADQIMAEVALFVQNDKRFCFRNNKDDVIIMTYDKLIYKVTPKEEEECEKLEVLDVEPQGDTSTQDDPLADTKFVDSFIEHSCHCASWAQDLTSGMSTDEIDVKNIFDREMRIGGITWNTTTTVGTMMLDYDFPSSYLANNFTAQAALAAHSFFVGELVIRVRVTSSPKTSGAIVVAATPLGSFVKSTSHREALGCPNIILSAATSGTGILVIPLIYPTRYGHISYFNNDMSLFNCVNVRVFTMSPLRDAASVGAGIIMFARIRNARVLVPTVTGSWSIIAQGDTGSHEKTEGDGTRVDGATMNSVINQSAVGVSDHMDMEVQRVLRKMGAVVRTFGSVAIDTLAAVKTTAMIAAMVGLSKPTSNADLMIPVPSIGHYDGQSIGVSNATVLASSQRSVVVRPKGVFGCHYDELDVAYFCSRPGWLTQFTVSSSQTAGTIVFTCPITPCCFDSNSAATTIYPTCLSLCALMFRMWRGGLTYKFIPHKTTLQSGALEFLIAGGDALTSASSDSRSASLKRVIFVYTERNALTIHCPQESDTNWLDTSPQPMGNNPVNVGTITPTCCNGNLVCKILEPLVASDGDVSSTIDFTVLISGMPDIEFALPCTNPGMDVIAKPQPGKPNLRIPVRSALLVNDLISKMDDKGKDEVFLEVEPQGGPGLFEDDEEEDVVTLRQPRPLLASDAVQTVGERTLNLRTLFRGTFIGGQDFFEGVNSWLQPGAGSASGNLNPGTCVFIDVPIHLGTIYNTENASNGISPPWIYILDSFAFFGGSFGISFTVDCVAPLACEVTVLNTNGLTYTFNHPTLSFTTLGSYWSGSANHVFDVQSAIPTRATGKVSCLGANISSFWPLSYLWNNKHNDQIIFRIWLRNNTPNIIEPQCSFVWNYFFSDDFSAGWQCGLPSYTFYSGTKQGDSSWRRSSFNVW